MTNGHGYKDDSNSTFLDEELSNSLLNVIPDSIAFQASTPIMNNPKELEFTNNLSSEDSVSLVLEENVQRKDDTDQAQGTTDCPNSINNISENSDVQIDKENISINQNEADTSSSFSQIFIMPSEFLPKKKKAKLDKSGKSKPPAASTLEGWAEIFNAKEKARKFKEEKAAKRKALQEEKKKLAEEKKLLTKQYQDKLKEIQNRIKQEACD